MLKWTPQLSDRMLMNLGRQQGPAVDNSATDTITAHAANQFAKEKSAENTQAGLNLGQRRLDVSEDQGTRSLAQRGSQFDESLGSNVRQFDTSLTDSTGRFDSRVDMSSRHFDDNLSFNKDAFGKDIALRRQDFKNNKNDAGTAAKISLAGLALSGVEAYNSSKRSNQYKTQRKNMIKRYKNMGTDEGSFYAKMIELLGD